MQKKFREIFLKSNNWNDFNEKIKCLSTSEKGEIFENLNKIFLTLNPKYRTKLINVWLLKEVPSEVKTKLNLPPQDEGIDLVAKTKEGKYWAIQSKYRSSKTRSLTRDELSTFLDLTFNICKNFSHALICSNATRISYKFSLYKENVSFCSSEVWTNLEESFFSDVKRYLKKQPFILKELIPRKHQKAAINASKGFFQQHDRGKLIHPCASGKTLTAYWIAKEQKAKKILIVVPNLNLINQTLEEWANRFLADSLDVSWICVCSDQTVKNITLNDDIDPRDLGIEVVTNPESISQWLNTNRSDIQVIFSTYQSGPALAEATRNSTFGFDIAIMDEAHKTVGQKGTLFTHLLSNENIEVSKRLFMTATEKRFRGNSEEILSMDQEEIYGPTMHLYTFREAIEDGVLSDYNVVTIHVTKEEVKQLIDGNFYVKPKGKYWTKEIESQMLASTVALQKAYFKYDFTHALSYHSSIARAKAFKQIQESYEKSCEQTGLLNVFHVEGSTPAGVRSQIFKDFINSKRALITNVRCLAEGVDIPRVDGLLFADSKKSSSEIVQIVGRSLRPFPNKEKSYIIVPVLIDESIDDLETIKHKTFDSILTIAKALAANDERIIEYFRVLSSKPKRSINRDCFPFEIDLPISKEIDMSEFIEEIELRLWGKIGKLSYRPFNEARDFVRSLNLSGYHDWIKYCKGELPHVLKKPADIPSAAWDVYKNKGWISLGDWLGSGFIATYKRKYRSFEKARYFVHQLQLTSQSMWSQYCKGNLPEKGIKPEDIPCDPAKVYKDCGWIGVGDWLGTGVIATRKLKYRPFIEAREFVKMLGLKNQNEWKKYCEGKLPDKGIKPKDIPANPNITYKEKGWVNYGDWLGTGYISPRHRKYQSFEMARSFTRDLKLSNYKEWRCYCDGKMLDKPFRPIDIPSKPDLVYRNKGWISWADFLGTDNIAHSKKNFLSYKDAKNFIQVLGMKSQTDWKVYCRGTNPSFGKRPNNIPKAPDQYYAEWTTWGDWLGTGYIACSKRKYQSYEDAKNFASSLSLKSRTEWRSYTKGIFQYLKPLPEDIPAYPEQTYKNKGWKGYGDFLGTGIISSRFIKYRSFSEAREFVRKLGLKNQKEWSSYCKGELEGFDKKPIDIPSTPSTTYKNKGWHSLGDWLGTGIIAYSKRAYLSYEEARDYVHKLRLKNSTEWFEYCRGILKSRSKNPSNIPNRPEVTYKNKGWKDYSDWLGSSFIPTFKQYRPFEKARKFARMLDLKTMREWRLYCQGKLINMSPIPIDIPFKPERVYTEEGWKGYPDWLGNKRRASPRFIEYLLFPEARKIVRLLKLKNSKEWLDYCKGELSHLGLKPRNIPTHPERHYKNSGWKGYGDWLGTSNHDPKSRKFLSYDEAKEFVHKLKLKSRTEWNQYCAGKLLEKNPLPNNIPRDPATVYKNKGWLGVGDWLGTNRKATHLREYLPFEKARDFARSLGLKNRDEWNNLCKERFKKKTKLPDNIPRAPWVVYKGKGWKGINNWLYNDEE